MIRATKETEAGRRYLDLQRKAKQTDKPQLAWDLARVKLESYLDRNLSQVRSIYWLTLFVMLFGFGIVIYGLQHTLGAILEALGGQIYVTRRSPRVQRGPGAG